MRTVDRLLVGAGVLGALAALGIGTRAVFVRRWRRARATSTASAGVTGAGVMFVGAVDEVELGAGLARPMRPDISAEGFDPEEVPSEHAEINELRTKMPFG